MADDQNQRPYRNDAATRGNGGTSGNDPLAELARLIGQNDPFAEYGRNNAGRAAPQVAEPTVQAVTADRAPYVDEPYSGPGYGRQAFGSAPLAANGGDLYQVDDAHAPGYQTQGYDAQAYDAQAYEAQGYVPGAAAPGYDSAFPPSQEPLHDVHQQFGPATSDDYYDDVAPSRRRISIAAIAGVFALAVLGTAGAFGYRAMFGPSSAPGTPPVIKADGTPSKIVAAQTNKDSGKAITDRVGNNGQIEKLLSREEQPVAVTTTPNQPGSSVFPPNPASNAPAAGSGIVGDPKKIRTIAIRPDQPDGTPVAAEPSAPAQAPVRVVNTTPVVEPPPRPAIAEPSRSAPARNPASQAAAPTPRQAAAPSNAPLSLNPNAAPARAERVASAPVQAAPAAASSGGGYAVQVSAQRSEADAQAAFQTLRGKYPSQLGSRQPFIKRVDLGAKGVYYRAMVAVGSSGEASELCSSLKAAGGQCIVQRN
ncbi:MAG: SPOR domain-containing protein [Pseudolabrys sp.]|jgi:hypothetical protein